MTYGREIENLPPGHTLYWVDLEGKDHAVCGCGWRTGPHESLLESMKASVEHECTPEEP